MSGEALARGDSSRGVFLGRDVVFGAENPEFLRVSLLFPPAAGSDGCHEEIRPRRCEIHGRCQQENELAGSTERCGSFQGTFASQNRKTAILFPCWKAPLAFIDSELLF